MSMIEPLPGGLSITVEHEPATEVTRALFDGLSRANVERTGDGEIARLCLIARDSGNVLAGGIYGELYWGWLNILALWVSPDLRRKGLGCQLLARAESEALAKGCRGVYLDTFTFQNVALYTRAGYEVFGTLEHFPSGHSRHFLRKRLQAAELSR
jgi:GNAT superfamily N-acetyltransferase